MRFVVCIMLCLCWTFTYAQLEKIGVYYGTSLAVQRYNNPASEGGHRGGFFTVRHRVGAMASIYGDRRFSYEAGLLLDFYNNPERKRLGFSYKDGLQFRLDEHSYQNVGIPFSVTMRTNTTRNCVTYFRFSLVNLFTIRDKQRISYVDEISNFDRSISIGERAGIRYYSTDIDFGFGTFWYLKKLGAKFCLEPKVTLIQYRNDIYSVVLQDRRIAQAELSLLTNIGFEITLYKDLF